MFWFSVPQIPFICLFLSQFYHTISLLPIFKVFQSVSIPRVDSQQSSICKKGSSPFSLQAFKFARCRTSERNLPIRPLDKNLDANPSFTIQLLSPG
ncbi:hypothetical protein GQ43DRAFT_311319 [Delitschia confertaspora ATCC 74209]|uniref:Uncharacterized protein n=1 Tax=Delitschia confertaspora ATCC 74209 TaxID=1513339 RepID=A0A9P4JNR0_9PLEO|nr:hypothetical protein GQ43DRAFT_311319 [Delitschia confertaspora ATCC 74209]